MSKEHPTPWTFNAEDEFEDAPIRDRNGDCVLVRDAGYYPPDLDTCREIVEAVNANGAWREERRRLQLEAASAEKAFNNADARRTLLERYYCEVYADRNRRRGLVRDLVDALEEAWGHQPPSTDAALLQQARKAIGEGEAQRKENERSNA